MASDIDYSVIGAVIGAAITYAAVDSSQSPTNSECNFDAFAQNGASGAIPADVTTAQANVFYACKYLNSVRESSKKSLLISLLQYAAGLYFADKQYETAKQAQNRLDETWEFEKEWATTQRDHWKNHYQNCEAAFVDEYCAKAKQTVDYTAIANRVSALIEQNFAPLYDKIDCIPLHCVGARCDAQRKLDIEKAKAKTAMTEQEYRREEERIREENRKDEEVKYKLLGIGRGYVTGSLNAIQQAQTAATSRGGIDPYAGFAGVIGGVAGAVNGYYQTNAFANNFATGLTYNQGFNPTANIGSSGYVMPNGSSGYSGSGGGGGSEWLSPKSVDTFWGTPNGYFEDRYLQSNYYLPTNSNTRG